MIIVLMGPAGAGKSTVGRALSARTGWPFHDADDLHDAASIAKMRQGVPLDDRDRQPWLCRVRDLLAEIASTGGNAVLACSALREEYRRLMSDGVPGVTFVMLETSRSVLEHRLEARRGHFAGAAILDRQLEDLEVPRQALIVDAASPVSSIVARICRRLDLRCADAPHDG